MMAQDCVKALESSYNREDFTCQLSDVLDALKGTDVNFEIVKAQTVRPLKLEYVHDKARIVKAFVFAWTELTNFAKWIKTLNIHRHNEFTQTATECIEDIKQQLQDKNTHEIDEVHAFTDLSKAETIE